MKHVIFSSNSNHRTNLEVASDANIWTSLKRTSKSYWFLIKFDVSWFLVPSLICTPCWVGLRDWWLMKFRFWFSAFCQFQLFCNLRRPQSVPFPDFHYFWFVSISTCTQSQSLLFIFRLTHSSVAFLIFVNMAFSCNCAPVSMPLSCVVFCCIFRLWHCLF